MANPPRITDADIAVYGTPEMQDLASAILLALAEADKDARTAIQKQGGIRVLALMRASTISLAQVTVQSAISIAMATA